MTFMITAIFLAVSAFVTCTQSAYLVNCPTNFVFNAQYHMCVQQSHCGLLNQNCAINYAPFQYQYLSSPTYYHSICQPTICPCYYSTCQHIQYCYHQIPCFYWNITTTTTPQPTVTTTTTTATTTITTTAAPFGKIISSTEREIEPTTKSTKTTKWPDTTKFTTQRPHDTEFDRPEIELKMNNIIQTHNNIHHPIYVRNTNIVTFEKNESRIEHKTTSKPTTQTTATTKVPTSTKRRIRPKSKCCTVYSPKLCKRRYDGSWYCYHSNYRRCGHFCYREYIYLRPRHIEYHPPTLVIPPPGWNIEHYQIDYDYELTMDCSGCIYGEYHCSLACYSYSCNTIHCGYIDQHRFCEHYGGHGCSEHDGYFSVDYY